MTKTDSAFRHVVCALRRNGLGAELEELPIEPGGVRGRSGESCSSGVGPRHESSRTSGSLPSMSLGAVGASKADFESAFDRLYQLPPSSCSGDFFLRHCVGLKRPLRTCYLVLPVLASLIAVASPFTGFATARSLRPSALLTFSSRYGLCLAQADGSHRIRLFPKGRNPGVSPSWSPSGRYLALVNWRRAPRRKFGVDSRIMVVTATGRVVRELVDADWVTGAAWSPDGRYVAIGMASLGGGIFLIAPNGSGERRLIGSQTTEFFDPAWAPDGQRLVFVGAVPPSFSAGIWSIHVDRSDLRLLIPGGSVSGPSFSPDGTRLAYSRDGDIYAANSADGSAEHALTATRNAEEAAPAWSPDGTVIAFVRWEKGRRYSQIVTIHPDGSGERTVIPRRYAAGAPTWRRPVTLRRSERSICG